MDHLASATTIGLFIRKPSGTLDLHQINVGARRRFSGAAS